MPQSRAHPRPRKPKKAWIYGLFGALGVLLLCFGWFGPKFLEETRIGVLEYDRHFDEDQVRTLQALVKSQGSLYYYSDLYSLSKAISEDEASLGKVEIVRRWPNRLRFVFRGEGSLRSLSLHTALRIEGLTGGFSYVTAADPSLSAAYFDRVRSLLETHGLKLQSFDVSEFGLLTLGLENGCVLLMQWEDRTREADDLAKLLSILDRRQLLPRLRRADFRYRYGVAVHLSS